MVFEHLRNWIHPEDSMSGFLKLFQLCFHIVKSHISLQIACVLGVTRLLFMTKPLGEVCPIEMGETLYQLTNHVLYLQFHDVFATHFSTQQFKITIKDSYETVSPQHQVHPNPLPCLGHFLIKHGKHFQFGVKKGHISRTSCSRWKHHATHPFCLCILCI